MTPYHDSHGMTVYNTDARRLTDILEPGSCRAIVTDPPYELGLGTAGRVARWDSTGIAFDPGFWSSLLPLVTPGAYLLAFGGTRTWHRMACAIEDAGWLIRDQICWLYSSGMPKGEWGDHAVDRTLGHPDTRPARESGDDVMSRRTQREGDYMPADARALPYRGFNPALKPAWEPIIVAQRPRDDTLGRTLLDYGTGALNVDAARLDADMDELRDRYRLNALDSHGPRHGDTFKASTTPRPAEPRLEGRYPSNLAMDPPTARLLDAPPFYYCPKATGMDRPVEDAERLVAPGGPDWTTVCERLGLRADATEYPESVFPAGPPAGARPAGVARIAHPTVKPLDLVRWLVRLACPPGGRVLDPFLGSGTTMLACRMENLECTGSEYDPVYLPLIARRLDEPAQSTLFA